MAINTIPPFGKTPEIGFALLTTANTSLTNPGAGSVILGFTAGADGAIVKEINIAATQATTAGKIHIFIEDGAGNYYFYDYIPVPASGALSATVNPFQQRISRYIKLKANHQIYYTTYLSETFTVTTFGDQLEA